MALDKKRASTMTRIGIGIVAVMLVMAFIPWNSIGLSGSGDGSTLDSAGQLDVIAQQYSPTINTFEAQLASDPTSYTVLVNLGNTYFDWAVAVQQAQPEGQTYDRPMWVSASSFYARALAEQPGDQNVTTDYAVSLYYGGDLDAAIANIESVIAQNPDFPTAHFNAAIFYRSAGRLGDAAAAATQYLALDPTGQTGSPELANEIIAEGAGQPVTPSTPATATSVEETTTE